MRACVCVCVCGCVGACVCVCVCGCVRAWASDPSTYSPGKPTIGTRARSKGTHRRFGVGCERGQQHTSILLLDGLVPYPREHDSEERRRKEAELAVARGVVIAVRCRQDGLLRRVPHCSAGVLQTRELVHRQVLAQAGDRITHPASAKLMWRQQDVNRRVLPFLAE